MKNDIARAAEKFINLEVIALSFLLPLFFLPVTTEFFEFNKLILLAVAVILGATAWGIKVAAKGHRANSPTSEVKSSDTSEVSPWRGTPFDIPVLFLWLATLVSTVLSEHLTTSLAGQYLRWHPSLATITVFTAFYFILTSNLKPQTLKYIGYALLASASLAGLLFIPQYFGANLFGQEWSAGRTFTLLGSPNTLALFLGVTVPLALRRMIFTSAREHLANSPTSEVGISNTSEVIPWRGGGIAEVVKKCLGLALTLLLLLVLTMLNSAVGWVALAVSFAISLSGILNPSGLESPTRRVEIRQSWPYLLVTLVAFVAFVALILIPPIRSATPFRDGPPQEIGLDLRTSWSVSATSFRQRPVWGSGPGTFLFDFTRYKPLSYNYTPLWSIRFDKPISEYLLAFAEMGLLGVLAYLFLIVTLIRNVFTRQPNNQTTRQLLPIGAGVLAAFFLTCLTAVSGFLLILALASVASPADSSTLRVGDSKPEGFSSAGPGQAGGYIALGLSVIFAFFLGLGVHRISAAELANRQSIQAFKRAQTETTSDRMIAALQSAYNQQLRALSHVSWQSQYHANLAQISFTWANALAGRANLTDEERSNIQTLVAQTISEAKRATELSPLNVNNWEVLAQAYRTLIDLYEGAEDWAANSYLRAINLDVFNPILRVDFGGLFYRQGDYERAIEQFRAAVNLKNNYANAHYNLGVAYKETDKIDLAIQEIETALRLTPEDTPGYEEAKAVLEELKSQK